MSEPAASAGPSAVNGRAEKSLPLMPPGVEDARALAEALPHIVWIARADGFNVYCNQQWMD